MIVTKILLIVGIAATLTCFARGRARSGVLASYLGAFAVLIGWLMSRDSPSTWPMLLSVEAFALVATLLALGPEVLPGGDQTIGWTLRGGQIRRSLSAGLIGLTPGLVLVVVPLMLLELGLGAPDLGDLIYLGLPMLVLGLIVGVAFGATHYPRPRGRGDHTTR